ncbi:MAG: hypothetical protein LBG60_06835 [Bifidobacteriaceae bacterium]|jgi:hypothetical protein|nr:hypothetical protein [Bifidobacteriaceae bacterium]
MGRGRTNPLKQALGSVGSFSMTLGLPGVSFGFEAKSGRADSGALDFDLLELVEDLDKPLKQHGVGFAVFVDEMQDLDREFTAALLGAQHKASQRGWPFYVCGAGLPGLPGRLAGVRSYAERLFDYRTVGPLDEAAARQALSEPAGRSGAFYTDEALRLVLEAAQGYPYFLQEFGSAVWQVAPDSPFTESDARSALEAGRAALDAGFSPARWSRATAAERSYLRAMAQDGDAGSATGDIAARLNKPPKALSTIRARLIAKGLAYSPRVGVISFTVPLMADFIERQYS